jgi:ABC-2 type transport system permease protein
MSGRRAHADLTRQRWRGVGALAERESARVLRLWTQTIAPQVIAATLFVVVFGIALGSQIDRVAGVPYDRFIVPGLVLMGVATQAFANNATSIYQARQDGFIEDPATSPMRASHLLVGYMSGGVLRSLLIGLGTLGVARVFVDYSIERPDLLALTLIAAAIAFAALGTVVGLYSDGWEQQNFVGNLVIQPLAFLGGVFYAVDSLPSPWFEITHADPIFYMVAAARQAMLGDGEVSTLLAVGITLALAGAMVAWAWSCFARGVGIRT